MEEEKINNEENEKEVEELKAIKKAIEEKPHKNYGLIILILSIASYGCLFFKYIFTVALMGSAGLVLNVLFFALAFICIMTSLILKFVVKKENNLDAITIFNLIALFICFMF